MPILLSLVSLVVTAPLTLATRPMLSTSTQTRKLYLPVVCQSMDADLVSDTSTGPTFASAPLAALLSTLK
jgi:hypothetical protein